ncbi:hypothetical protein EV356DRAFT_27274 [Viridothelium virens]|uniref:Zn(2)-C6 fungal-type domain-containing protein n=1 Tax=Viridothelium virens TaxID=1048519 RepID=A0A6A6HGJ0_VIRVR|nr:hypothetical protein EV356DRAFT_27274 [Viridothelium virens]
MSPPEAPVKLRSTCDACSIAKVKCDKKQPVCDRCQTNGFRCSYSPSRRHGKQSWAKMIAKQQYLNSTLSPTPLTETPPLVPPSLLPLPPLNGANDDSGLYMVSDDLSPVTHQAVLPDESMDVGGHDGRQSTDYLTLIGLDTAGDGLDFMSHWTGAESAVDLNNVSEASDMHVCGTSLDPNFNSISFISEPPQASGHDCEAKAFNTLHSLHYCTMFHTDQPGVRSNPRTNLGHVLNRTPPLDKVLYFNRVAMNTLKELLECPCAQQAHLALLYTTIVSKALSWYRSAVSPQGQSISLGSYPTASSPNTSGSSTSAVSPVSTQSKASTAQGIQSTPIQIGVFDLEEEDQRVLMRGILLREVRKVEGIVDEITIRGSESTRDEDGDDEQHTKNWYRIVGPKIKAEVLDTLKQIKEFGAGLSRTGGT